MCWLHIKLFISHTFIKHFLLNHPVWKRYGKIPICILFRKKKAFGQLIQAVKVLLGEGRWCWTPPIRCRASGPLCFFSDVRCLSRHVFYFHVLLGLLGSTVGKWGHNILINGILLGVKSTIDPNFLGHPFVPFCTISQTGSIWDRGTFTRGPKSSLQKPTAAYSTQNDGPKGKGGAPAIL